MGRPRMNEEEKRHIMNVKMAPRDLQLLTAMSEHLGRSKTSIIEEGLYYVAVKNGFYREWLPFIDNE